MAAAGGEADAITGSELAAWSPDDDQEDGGGSGAPKASAGERDAAPVVERGPGNEAVARLRGAAGTSWQVPTLLAAGALLAAGIGVSFSTAPRPEFGAVLESAEALNRRQRYVESINLLNTHVSPYLRDGSMSDYDRGVYHLLAARAVSGWQRDSGVDSAENDATIVEQYTAAERAGAELTENDLFELGRAQVATGDVDGAEVSAEQMDGLGDGVQRRALHKLVIDAHLSALPPRPSRATGLLTEVLTDPRANTVDRAWAIGRQSDILLGEGYTDQVIGRLLRELHRLSLDGGVDERTMGELYLRLGRAYFAEGELSSASEQLAVAVELLDGDEASTADALMRLGMIEESSARLSEARALYARVVEQFRETPSYAEALMRLGGVEAATESLGRAIDAYGQLVDLLLGEESARYLSPTVAELTGQLLNRSREQLERSNPRDALRLAELAARANGVQRPADETPREVLAALSLSHRAMAESLLERGNRLDLDQRDQVDGLAPGLRREAQGHLIRAGYCASRHADVVAASDPEAYADSLWAAGELYDLASAREEARRHYERYVQDMTAEPDHTEARFRLAQVLEAMGEHVSAGRMYKALIDDGNAGLLSAGVFADRSVVPLARCWLADADPENDAAAEQYLNELVGGQALDPESGVYLTALETLGERHLQAGRHGEAIRVYTELMRRVTPERPRSLARYRLAESYRQSVKGIAEQLAEESGPSLLDGERRRLRELRNEHLTRAIEEFERFRTEMDARARSSLSRTESLALRNSFFDLGDCAFDLGEYERAIRYYQAAKHRYEDDPASLVAMTQIVSAYQALGDLEGARAADGRARIFFDSFRDQPDEIWDDPTLPMGRKEWERWLESNRVLYETADGSAEPG